MQFKTTVSSKGQIVIPKKLRDILKIKSQQSITISLDEKKKEVIIKKEADILDLVESGQFPLRSKKSVSALKARDLFEEKYERF